MERVCFRSLGVIPRSSRSIAFADSDGEVVLVSRSFLNILAVTLLNPSSVSQSTTEARTRQGYHGRKPSESFMIVHASRRLPAEQTKHIRRTSRCTVAPSRSALGRLAFSFSRNPCGRLIAASWNRMGFEFGVLVWTRVLEGRV